MAVLFDDYIQVYGYNHHDGHTQHVPFPLDKSKIGKF